MPDNPTWTQVAEFAAKLNDKANRSYGLCIRGQPGCGENMAKYFGVTTIYKEGIPSVHRPGGGHPGVGPPTAWGLQVMMKERDSFRPWN